jgi:hypothetical protein
MFFLNQDTAAFRQEPVVESPQRQYFCMEIMQYETPTLGDERCWQALGSAPEDCQFSLGGSERDIRDGDASQCFGGRIFSFGTILLSNPEKKRKNIYTPLTATMPVIGIHSRDPSGKTVGLLRVGSASK